VDGWNTQGLEEIVVGKRRLRAKRRRGAGRGRVLAIVLIIVALLGLAGGGYYWFTRPRGLSALPNPAVVAPGGFRTNIDAKDTITVGLEIRNIADVPVTVISARITPPRGLTQVALVVVPPGTDNQNFTLGGTLPASQPVELGTKAGNRNAIVEARFTVACRSVPAQDEPVGEEIFVTIQVGSETRVEELTPPALGDVPWLTATAQRLCHDPVPTASADPPLPPLPPLPAVSTSPSPAH
jgi:hypothetical protein